MVARAGVTWREVKVAGVTVNVTVAVWPPKAAVISEAPLVTPVARPVAGLMVATAVEAEVQLDEAVTSPVDPSS
jgi:hypothetical protein